jgi:hypothetical protein
MATKKKSKKAETPQRDFFNEYNEIMHIAGREMERIETDWNNNGGRIKKFSLYDKTPTPILSNNSQPFNL